MATRKIIPPPLATLPNPVLSCLSGHLNPIVLEPFDVTLWYSGVQYHEHQICLRFHRILKVILEMAFSSHCTPIWKLNRISTTIINKVTRKCIWCCHRVQRCVTSPGFGVKLCSGAWKRGPDSHVVTFSLCHPTKVGRIMVWRGPSVH